MWDQADYKPNFSETARAAFQNKLIKLKNETIVINCYLLRSITENPEAKGRDINSSYLLPHIQLRINTLFRYAYRCKILKIKIKVRFGNLVNNVFIKFGFY